MAAITKTTTRSYEILTAVASKPIFVFGEFIRIRKKRGLKTRRFEHCFGCGHGFKDEENVYFGAVKRKGNIFFCKACADKYCTENKSEEDQ